MSNEYDQAAVEKAVRDLLAAIGEDPDRDGLVDTPARLGRSFAELLEGYNTDPREHLRRVFPVERNDLVLVKDIPFHSMCEHHLLPFVGKAHVGYIPKGQRVTGLSKLARLVDGYSHRLQVQERLTQQIADAVWEVLSPQGGAPGRTHVHDDSWSPKTPGAHHHLRGAWRDAELRHHQSRSDEPHFGRRVASRWENSKSGWLKISWAMHGPWII